MYSLRGHCGLRLQPAAGPWDSEFSYQGASINPRCTAHCEGIFDLQEAYKKSLCRSLPTTRDFTRRAKHDECLRIGLGLDSWRLS